MRALAVAALLALCGVCGAQEGITPKSNHAWVTIFYEAGRNDDEYFLGARVLMQSIKDSGTEADRIVVIANGVQERYSKGFENDGLMLYWVDSIPSPWAEKTLKRFAFSLNKLRIWQMTKYDRVIFLDADVIVVQPADFLFNCGHFCAVYFNPVSFHTAILVVKPDQDIYNDMENRLKNGIGSFDGADQGFINSYFNKFVEAKEWTKEDGKSEAAMNRLPIPYNMHHIYYYEKMSWWGPFTDGKGPSAIVTVTYPIAPFLKPWCWWAYPLLDMHQWWVRYRNQIEGWMDYPMELIKIALIPVLHVVFSKLRAQWMPSATATAKSESVTADSWFSWGPHSCQAVGVGYAVHFVAWYLAYQMVPQITPPMLAWIEFLGYHALFLFHVAAVVWKMKFGGKFRVENLHIVMYAASWGTALFLMWFPSYPHGAVKFFGLAFAVFAAFFIQTFLYKMVYDHNVKPA
eukprot:TRINITY_DN30099_c0_g1_i1.p1 TRINITY_DN30099_c0_g1~~TRINITY_DN30099_c0_g1_i1.p1  ORF type:complete len:460 (+),score=181.64 TRINITY_DN30099_c0_g1_i1:40-1419(+)